MQREGFEAEVKIANHLERACYRLDIKNMSGPTPAYLYTSVQHAVGEGFRHDFGGKSVFASTTRSSRSVRSGNFIEIRKA